MKHIVFYFIRAISYSTKNGFDWIIKGYWYTNLCSKCVGFFRFTTKKECLNAMDPYCGWNRNKVYIDKYHSNICMFVQCT